MISQRQRRRTITATEASRRFPDLIDAIESGETVTITRGHRVIAEIRPARPRAGRDLRAALAGIQAPDGAVEASIADAMNAVLEENGDPWRISRAGARPAHDEERASEPRVSPSGHRLTRAYHRGHLQICAARRPPVRAASP